MARHEEAIALLMDVIKVHPYLQDTYHTLGLAHEALGRQRKALDFYMIAVHMTPADVDLWRRLANLSTNLGFFRQAIYCYTKVSCICVPLCCRSECSLSTFDQGIAIHAVASLASCWGTPCH